MDYSVGLNKPIKLKIEVDTESIPITYTFLGDTGHSNGESDIEPFNPSLKTGWKKINNGKPVQGKTLIIATDFRFFNSFPNEETFNLAVLKIKESYKALLIGGLSSKLELSFTSESIYSKKICFITSSVKLI